MIALLTSIRKVRFTLYKSSVSWVTEKCSLSVLISVRTKRANTRENTWPFRPDKQNCLL